MSQRTHSMLEKALQQSQAQLDAAKLELESFIESTADAIVVLSLSGMVLRVNSAFERIYGWSSEEAVGRYAGTNFPEVGEWLASVEQGCRISAVETVRKRKDGTPVHVSVTLSPIYNRDGKVVAMSSITRDITDRVIEQEMLRRSEKLSLVGEMAAAVAHELRNPITVLQGFTRLLQENATSDQVRYCTIMLSEFERINAILNELLLLAKPQKANAKPINLSRVLLDVVTLLRMPANDKGLTLEYHVPRRDAFVHGVEHELKQVFINIIKNAIEATPSGKNIEVNLSAKGKEVLVRCIDEGCGISGEQISRLGEPFYTTKTTGTGLGLTVTYRIIESHGGHVDITGRERGGTTVQLTLPRVQTDDSALSDVAGS